MPSGVLAGRYELGRRLGDGGMALVYEAHDGLLDRAVAIKVLRPEASADVTARRRFLTEARAAASFDHRMRCGSTTRPAAHGSRSS